MQANNDVYPPLYELPTLEQIGKEIAAINVVRQMQNVVAETVNLERISNELDKLIEQAKVLPCLTPAQLAAKPKRTKAVHPITE
jgi:hypothetical protein